MELACTQRVLATGTIPQMVSICKVVMGLLGGGEGGRAEEVRHASQNADSV
jgi:hypothetical protein